MLDIGDAQRIVLLQVRTLSTVECSLRDALGRTLAAPVVCDVDDPPFDKALMDGYAVRSVDVVQAPTTLRVVGQVGAGHLTTTPVGPGEALQINTGAALPPRADAVVRIEDTDLAGNQVRIKATTKAGKFVVPRGTYARAGKTVLPVGSVMTPVHLGVAATAGASTVSVYRPPSVGILTTGDELVDIDRLPIGAQIRNSNRYLLDGLFRSTGIEPRNLGTVGDDCETLRQRIAEGVCGDLLCITGGVSMGAFDLVPETLEGLGATVHFHKIAIKPGRPTLFAATGSGTLVFALPGNPISAFIGFELLVRPALAAMQGRPVPGPRYFAARVLGGFPAAGARRTYHPAIASVMDDGQWSATKLSWGGSGDSMGMARANAMIVRPPNAPAVADGEFAFVFLLDPLL